jgi:hypothetical protein
MMETESPARDPRRVTGATKSHTGKRQLRNYLLDRFQLRYTAVIVLVSAFLTATAGSRVLYFAHEATETAKVNVITNMEEGATRDQVLRSFAQSDRDALLWLVGLGFAFCVLVAVYGIVITHKVAGPLHKIASHFADVRANRLKQIWPLRKGDQLQDFFESFQSMHDALRKRQQDEAALLREVLAAVQGSPVAATEAIGRLRTLAEAKEASVAG